MQKVTYLLLLLLVVSSCATKKQIIYFQDADELLAASSAQTFEPTVEVNDVLHISVSSINKEVVAPFLKNSDEVIGNNQNQLLRGYLVNSNGDIRFPVLGELSVVGKTRAEIEGLLKEKLIDFITDVVVDVRIMNFKVTVIGAVNAPGVYSIQDERVTLPQAIGLAGDLTDDANRRDIVIIREENGKQKVSHIDFTQSEFFNSPYYFLKQNDIVYVEPSLRGVKKSGFIPDIPALLSLFTVVLSAVIIITR